MLHRCCNIAAMNCAVWGRKHCGDSSQCD